MSLCVKRCIAEVDEHLEKQLIKKVYYETFMDGRDGVHPLKVLGDIYMEEQSSEVPDLAQIRFAQGELYFMHKDYEAAIFKWENINNELEPWAKKNMADAYFELDLLSMAEDIYKTIETDSTILKMEVLLQLFSLYIQCGKLELAVDTIKEAVALDPDYPDVTEIARMFFEKHQDWSNALQLAADESIRTRAVSWFDVLQRYIEAGKTKQTEPSYYNEAMLSLYEVDQNRFEQLASALFLHYQQKEELRFAFLKEINHMLLHVNDADDYTWNRLLEHYLDAYKELISGKYLVREIAHLMPNTLKVWLSIASSAHALLAGSAVLAWQELFPSDVDEETIYQAEKTLSYTLRTQDGLQSGFALFESLMSWASENGVFMGERFKWMVRELLNLDELHLLVSGAGKSSAAEFLEAITSFPFAGELESSAVMIKDSEENKLTAIMDDKMIPLNSIEETREYRGGLQQMIVDAEMPIPFLQQHHTAIIHAKDQQHIMAKNLQQYLHFADQLLLVIDVRHSITEEEIEAVEKIQNKAPNLPVHFLLLQEEFGVQNAAEEVAQRIYTSFPSASIFSYSLHYHGQDQMEELGAFIRQMISGRSLEVERTKKVLYYIRKSINYLLEKRSEKENTLVEQISWNEEMQAKLKGAIHQLEDTEEGKVQSITADFNQLKNEMKDKITSKLPELFRQCSELITESSNFGNIHVELNEEMNRKAQQFIELEVLPEFHNRFTEWIVSSEAELAESQRFLDDIGEGFNDMYNEEKLRLLCDFKVLEDWARDADRMTRGTVRFEHVNILLKFSPSQFILKSAGKLFGGLQNKTMLHNRYKQFIEHEDYNEVTNQISERFIQPFDLFEQGLERDINIFFRQPFDVLEEAVTETKDAIEGASHGLEQMRKQPERYRDPLTLFDLRLRQYEWMISSNQEKIPYQ